jgi:gas vesicle protein
MRDEENYRKSGFSTGEKLTFLLIGGGIGAVVALLFAPKPGVELREDIADATRKGLEKGRETATQIGERAGEYYEVARERAGEYYDATRERAGELYSTAAERAGDLAQQVRGAAQRPANSLGAAIDAGKQAYHEEKRRTESGSIAEGRPTYPKELGSDGGERES